MDIQVTVPAQTITLPSVTTKTAIWKTVIPSQTFTIPAQTLTITIPDPIPAPVPVPPPTPPPAPQPIPQPVPAFTLYDPNCFWNKKLTTEVTHATSAGLVAELWENIKLAGVSVNCLSYSRPIHYVDSSTPKQKVFLTDQYATGGPVDIETQKGVPIPACVQASGGTDGHLCIIDKSANREYDFWQFKFNNGRWEARNAGILDGVSTSDGTLVKRNDGYWNSATATHLPLAGGVIRVAQDGSLSINQCVAIAINRPKIGYPVWPAKTSDGWYAGPNAIPEGTRFRFPANITIDPNWTPITKLLVTAIRDYGLIVMDKTGSGVSLYVEDPTQYGFGGTTAMPFGWSIPTILVAPYGGKAPYRIFGDSVNTPEFPWSKLEALA